MWTHNIRLWLRFFFASIFVQQWLSLTMSERFVFSFSILQLSTNDLFTYSTSQCLATHTHTHKTQSWFCSCIAVRSDRLSPQRQSKLMVAASRTSAYMHKHSFGDDNYFVQCKHRNAPPESNTFVGFCCCGKCDLCGYWFGEWNVCCWLWSRHTQNVSLWIRYGRVIL